jgi:hypothetical protein
VRLAALFVLAAAALAQPGFVPLFNGKDLDGWEGNPALWKVENGILVGSTDGNSIDRNTFLIAQRQFADFHLTAEVRLRNLNSGIQFRSTVQPGPGWVVTGYQADFSEAGEKSAWGNFYEEQGRGRRVMRTPDEGWQKGQKLYRKGGWNRVEVIAKGSRMELKLNGETTIVVTDDKASSGVIALQLHRGEPMRVEFREIRIKPL